MPDKTMDIEGDISQRTRQAFTFVRRLHVIGPLASTDFTMLWDLVKYGRALFPNVRHLRLEDAPGCGPAYKYQSDMEDESELKAERDDGSALFVRPNVCVWGHHSYRQVHSLVKHMRTFTVHGQFFKEAVIR